MKHTPSHPKVPSSKLGQRIPTPPLSKEKGEYIRMAKKNSVLRPIFKGSPRSR